MGFMFSLNVTTQRLWVDVSWRCFSVHQHIIHCSNTHTCWLLLISWMIIMQSMNMVFSRADCRQERRGLKDKVSHVPPQYRYHGELLQHRPGPQLHLLYNSVNFDPLYSVWRKMRLSLFFVFALIPVIQHTDVRPLRLLLYLWKTSFRSKSQSFGYWS